MTVVDVSFATILEVVANTRLPNTGSYNVVMQMYYKYSQEVTLTCTILLPPPFFTVAIAVGTSLGADVSSIYGKVSKHMSVRV